MAVSVVLDRPDIPVLLDEIPDIGPDLLVRTGHFVMDSSYTGSGGEALDLPAILGVDSVVFCHVEVTGGFYLSYEYAAKKLKAWYGDFDAVADGPLIEVVATTDLSSLTRVPFWALVRVALPSEL